MIPFADPSAAVFSPDRVYRYTLNREIEGDQVWRQLVCNFIMLNPSTADEITNDRTLRRCIDFARDWRYGQLTVTNLFGLRATDPRRLLTHADPVGPDNEGHLVAEAHRANMVILAWGNGGHVLDRGRRVLHLLATENIPWFYLGITKEGAPNHPLYLPGDTRPKPMDLESWAAVTAAGKGRGWNGFSNEAG